MNNNNTGL